MTATLALARDQHVEVLLRLADTLGLLGHRMAEWCGRAPFLEEEMALANMGLDFIGQAKSLYAHAGAIEGQGRDEDQLAFLRDAPQYRNYLIAEQPNGDFARTMARQLLVSVFLEQLWGTLKSSSDATLAGIAAKAEKEAAYHVRHTSQWVIRLGDGTQESKRRMQAGLDDMWMFTGELFEMDAIDQAAVEAGVGADVFKLRPAFNRAIDEVLAEATLTRPEDGWMQSGGRRGQHTEHLGHLLAVMQSLPRTHPGAKW